MTDVVFGGQAKMAAKRATSTGKIRETPWSLMNHTKILTPAAIFAALILSAVPAHAQRRGFSGRGGFGISRGPARALGVPRGFASPRGFAARRITAVAPFNGGRFLVRPPIRLG